MATITKPQALVPPSEAYDTFASPHFLAAFKPIAGFGCLPLPPPLLPDVSCYGSTTISATAKPRFQRKSYITASAGAPFQPCIECGKRFSSPKALYGHMRCHPDRPYRGMNPRSPLHRPLLLLGPRSAQPKFTDEEYEVARSLLLLAKTTDSGKKLVEEENLCDASVKKRAWKQVGREPVIGWWTRTSAVGAFVTPSLEAECGT